MAGRLSRLEVAELVTEENDDELEIFLKGVMMRLSYRQMRRVATTLTRMKSWWKSTQVLQIVGMR